MIQTLIEPETKKTRNKPFTIALTCTLSHKQYINCTHSLNYTGKLNCIIRLNCTHSQKHYITYK